MLTFYRHIYIYIPFWCKNVTNNSFEFSWYISYSYHTKFLDIHPQSCLLPIFIFAVFQSILWLITLTQDLYWTLNTTLRYNLNSHPKLLYQLKSQGSFVEFQNQCSVFMFFCFCFFVSFLCTLFDLWFECVLCTMHWVLND